MPESTLTLAQQLALCQQVARLVRSELPIAGELSRLNAEATGKHAVTARGVDGQLTAGKSLAGAIAADSSRASRQLTACIVIGEKAGGLATSLEAWTEMHLACARYRKTLHAALIYPGLLIVVTLASLTYVIWQLIPEYRAAYEQFSVALPVWVEWLVAVREQLGWVLCGMLLLAVAPLIVWYWHRHSLDAAGLPRDMPQRLQAQALSTAILKLGIDSGQPLATLVPWSVQASCGNPLAAEGSFAKVQQQQRVPQLASETSMLVGALHAGLLTADETSRHLAEVAQTLRQQADARAARAARWLPMLVALTIGGLTILTYVFLIYLPWIWLLRRIIEP